MTTTLTTERLILRPFELGDLESTYEYASNLENTRYMLWLPSASKGETELFLQKAVAEWEKDSPLYYEFAIIYNEKHIGAVSVIPDESGQEVEIGWIIHQGFHNMGFASEAARAALNFALSALSARKVVAHCDCRNGASRKVMEKIGLSLESGDGFRRYRDDRDNNESVREYMYSLAVR